MKHAPPHYFLAVPLPDDIQDQLAERAKTWQNKLPFKQWPHPRDYHITLIFLGAAKNQTVQQVKNQAAQMAARFAPFTLRLQPFGTFGKKDRPRVLWAGVSAPDTLYTLQSQLHQACTEMGFSLDRRPYKPHITIAKKWIGEGHFNRADLATHPEIEWTVEKMVLNQIHPGQTPKYESVATFPLQG